MHKSAKIIHILKHINDNNDRSMQAHFKQKLNWINLNSKIR